MPLLKDTYTTIEFPLPRLIPEKVLELYMQEFDFSYELDLRQAVILFANALRDYLDEKSTVEDFGSFSWGLYYGFHHFYLDQYEKLKKILDECSEIGWYVEAGHQRQIREELEEFLKELKAYYADNYEKDEAIKARKD